MTPVTVLYYLLSGPLAAIESHEYIGLASVAVVLLLAIVGSWARIEVRLARIEATQEATVKMKQTHAAKSDRAIDQLWRRTGTLRDDVAGHDKRLTLLERHGRGSDPAA